MLAGKDDTMKKKKKKGDRILIYGVLAESCS